MATSTFNQAGDLTGYTPAADQPARSSATYTYASDGLLTSETTAAGTTTYTWDVATSLPLLLSDGTYAYVYGPSSTPVEEVPLSTPAAAMYLITDAQGSVRVQLSSTGAVLGSVTYDANGNAEPVLGAITSPLGYDGQLHDSASGLLYLRARWYDPTTAQFVSVDPALATTHQAYEYAGDDPVNEVDLTGESFWSALGSATCAVLLCSGAAHSAENEAKQYLSQEVRSTISQVADIGEDESKQLAKRLAKDETEFKDAATQASEDIAKDLRNGSEVEKVDAEEEFEYVEVYIEIFNEEAGSLAGDV